MLFYFVNSAWLFIAVTVVVSMVVHALWKNFFPASLAGGAISAVVFCMLAYSDEAQQDADFIRLLPLLFVLAAPIAMLSDFLLILLKTVIQTWWQTRKRKRAATESIHTTSPPCDAE